MMVFRSTYFRWQQKILRLTHEPVILLRGQGQSARFVAKQCKVQHNQGITSGSLLASCHGTGPFEGHECVLHIVQLSQTNCG